MLKGPVEIFFAATDAAHTALLQKFHIPAAAETERQIGAREALLVFPVVEPVTPAVVFYSCLEISDAIVSSANEARAFVQGPVVVDNEIILPFNRADRRHEFLGAKTTF